MIIKVRNLLDQSSQNTFLSLGEASGTNALRVKNINPFTASWAIQIGKSGEELSEVKVLGTAVPSGTSVSITSNLTYAHPSDTPVYAIKYDKIIFKRSTAGTAGTATALTGGTVTITPDSDYTQFDDTSAASGYAYRASFYNSVTTEETSDSDWLSTSGFSDYALTSIRERTKNKLFSAGYLKNDAVVDEWINEWLNEMDRAAIKVNEGYNMGTVNVGFGTDGFATITTTDYIKIKRMWVTYDGVERSLATEKDIARIYPNEVFVATHPYYAWRSSTVFQVLPADTAGTAELIIHQRTSQLASDGDELPHPMRPFTNSFVNYALAEAYYNDGQDVKGDRYLARANQEKSDFIAFITPRDFTGVEMIQITDVVSGEDGYYM